MSDVVDRCIRIGGTTVHLYPNREDWKKFTDLIHGQYGHGAIAKTLWSLAQDYMKKFDDSGKAHKLDVFFGSGYIPKPDIDSDFDKNILPWLRTKTTDELNTLRINSYRIFVYVQGLIDTPPDQRTTVEFDYETLWKRYRW